MPAVKTNDSVKLKNKNQIINLKRENIYLTQTPQAFDYNELYKLQRDQSSKITDDANLFIAAGKKIKIINGEIKTIKLQFMQIFCPIKLSNMELDLMFTD